jgi:cardiolipin synthase
MASEPAAAPLIREVVSTLSPEFVLRLVRLLRSHASLADVTRARIMREVANDNACERIAAFITALSAARPDLSPEVAAFGIDCALETAEFESRAQSIDLVWTGPETSAVSVRRSAAVLLELIESARTDLLVMSFASFRIPDADAALSRAADRGVRMYLILESEEDSSGRYRQYGAPAFSALAHNPRVSYYCWPKEKRPHGALLHAKAVVADGSSALITSANLTAHAIDVNIEIGILIRGEPVPKRLRNHLLSLISSGEFEEVTLHG